MIINFLFYCVISYLIYGIYLVWQDYNTHWTNAPMYVRKFNPLMMVYVIIRKPLLINSGLRCFVIVLIISLILRFIFG